MHIHTLVSWLRSVLVVGGGGGVGEGGGGGEGEGGGGREFQIRGVEVPTFWTINLIPSRTPSWRSHPHPPHAFSIKKDS